MKFLGNGVVWDAENNKRLCKFGKTDEFHGMGVFETDDERTIARLDAMGFKHDEYSFVETETTTTSGDTSPEPPKAESVTADLGAKKLREIGKKLDLSFSASTSKDEMVSAINAKMEEVE